RLKAVKQPTSGKELDDFYSVPDAAEDVTALLLAAIAPLGEQAYMADAGQLPFVGGRDKNVPVPGMDWDENAEAVAFLRKYQSSLDKLHEAAAKNGWARFPVRLEDGFA